MKKLFLPVVFILLFLPVFGYFDIYDGPCAGMTDYECISYCDSGTDVLSECEEYYSNQEWFTSSGSSSNNGDFEQKEMNVEIEIIPSATIKPNSTIEKILLRFSFEDNTIVNPKNIKLIEVSALNEIYTKNDFEIDEIQNALVLNLNKSFPFEEFLKYIKKDITEDAVIRVNYAEDISGGELFGGSMKKLKFDSDADDFRIVAREWQTACFGTQHIMEFSLRSEGKKLEEIKARLFDIENKSYVDCNFLEEKSSDEIYKFICIVPIPKETQTASTELAFGIIVEAFEAFIGGEKQTATNIFYFQLENHLEMDMIYPMEGGTMMPDDPTEAAKLKIRIACINSSNLLGVDTIRAEINGKEATLVKNETEGYFEAENVFTEIKINEPFEISISLLDDFSGNEFHYGTYFEKRDFFKEDLGADELMLIVPIIVIALAIVISAFLLRRRKETAEDLEGKKKELEALIKQIEIEYYKRRITETDYKKRLLEYQEKLRLVDVKLGLKKQK